MMKKSLPLSVAVIATMLTTPSWSSPDTTINLAKQKADKNDTIAVYLHGSDWNKLGEFVKAKVWDNKQFRNKLSNIHFLSMDHRENPRRDMQEQIAAQLNLANSPLILENLRSTHAGTSFESLDGGIYRTKGAAANQESYQFKVEIKKASRVLIFDILGDKNNTEGRSGRSSNGNFAISEISAEQDGNKVEFAAAYANDSEGAKKAHFVIDGVNTAESSWNGNGHRNGKGRRLVLVSKKPLKGNVKISVHFNSWNRHSFSQFRVIACSSHGLVKATKSWHTYSLNQAANQSLKLSSKKYPAVILMNHQGETYARIEDFSIRTTPLELVKNIQQKQKLQQQREELEEKLLQTHGEAKMQIISQILDFNGIGLTNHNRNKHRDTLRKFGNQYSNPILRRHLFDIAPLRRKVSQLTGENKHRDALREINKELYHPQNSLLDSSKKQDICMIAFHLYRNWQGNKDKRFSVLEDIVAIDPNTHLGIGAQGYLMKEGRGPASITWGWHPRHIKSNKQTLNITVDTNYRLYRAGKFKLTARRSHGRNPVEIKQISLLADGKIIASNNQSAELKINLSEKQVKQKLTLRIRLHSPSGTDHYGKFQLTPVL